MEIEVKEQTSESFSLIIYSFPQTLPRPLLSRGRLINRASPLQQQLVQHLRFALPLNTVYPLWDNGIPLRVSLVFTFPLTASWSLKKKKSLAGSCYLQTPDIDNIVKFYLDSFNGVLYVDDKQIHSLTALKQWGHLNEEGNIRMKLSVGETHVKSTTEIF